MRAGTGDEHIGVGGYDLLWMSMLTGCGRQKDVTSLDTPSSGYGYSGVLLFPCLINPKRCLRCNE